MKAMTCILMPQEIPSTTWVCSAAEVVWPVWMAVMKILITRALRRLEGRGARLQVVLGWCPKVVTLCCLKHRNLGTTARWAGSHAFGAMVRCATTMAPIDVKSMMCK